LADYWNGSTWARETTPALRDRPDDTLYDVSCSGGSYCLAVGESYKVDRLNGHLIDPRAMGEAWDGSVWSPSTPVNPTGTTAALVGVSCPAPAACIAVGGASTASSESALVEGYTP
jgi:hypothetical protein